MKDAARVLLAAASGLTVCWSSAGCVDSRAALDDFNERYARTHADASDRDVEPGSCTLPQASDVTGRYLLALSPGFSSKSAILFFADFSAEPSSTEQLRVGLELVAISAADRHTAVGGSVVKKDSTLGAGSFDLDLGRVDISGLADPFIPNAAISGTLVLSGRLCATTDTDAASTELEILCGTASGNVTAPAALDLAGSTWAAVRIPDSSALPEPVLDCFGNPLK